MQILSNNNYGVTQLSLWYTTVQTLVWKIYERDCTNYRTMQDEDWPTDFDRQVKRK
jgi:hypothetical protein